MDVIWIAIIGLVAGIIAKLILPGSNGPRSWLMTAIIGVAGSFVGTFIGQFIGFYKPGEMGGFFGSIVGAAVILWLWDRMFKKRESA